VLVLVGREATTLAKDWDATREWIDLHQPTVVVDGSLESVSSLDASALRYLDERQDLFDIDPSELDSSDLDPDLHPTLIRLRQRPMLTGWLDLGDSSADERERRAVAQLRQIRLNFSPSAVADRLLRIAGVVPPSWRPEALTVITSHRTDFVADAVRRLASQTYRPLRIAVSLHGEASGAERTVHTILEETDIPHMVILRDEAVTQGACLNDLVSASPGDVVLKIDDDELYSPVYVEDMLGSLDYSGASIVGKSTAFYRLRNGTHVLLGGGYYGKVGHVVGSTITARRHVWDTVRFPNRHQRVDSKFLQAASAAGFAVASQHPWDFCVIRHDRNTWDASDDYFISTGRSVEITWSDLVTGSRDRIGNQTG
jgi:hypothetical protein